jgi:hypothetical protein
VQQDLRRQLVQKSERVLATDTSISTDQWLGDGGFQVKR